MALRIFYIVLALIGAYLSFEIYTLYSARATLFNTPANYALGPEDADLHVVEFLDYSCKYCREIHPTIMTAVQKDGRVSYAPRPLPSRDKESLHAAILTYAAGKQGKFMAMHDALIKNFRVINDDVLADIATDIDLDLEKLEQDINDKSIQDSIMENGALYNQLKGQATPFFMIGEKMFYVPSGSMPTVDDFLSMFTEARTL